MYIFGINVRFAALFITLTKQFSVYYIIQKVSFYEMYLEVVNPVVEGHVGNDEQKNWLDKDTKQMPDPPTSQGQGDLEQLL